MRKIEPDEDDQHVRWCGRSSSDLVGLDEVALLDVLVVLDADAALETVPHLGDVVLEPPQRGDLAVVDDDAVAEQASLGVAADHAARHVGAGDHAETWNPEGLADLGLAETSRAPPGSSSPDSAAFTSSIAS